MERLAVVDKSRLSMLAHPLSRPTLLKPSSAAHKWMVGSQSRCRVMLPLQQPLSLQFSHTLGGKANEEAHKCKVAAEPKRKMKEEKFELPDFFEIDKDAAALDLLFESAQLLKTARHYEVVFLVHEDHAEQVQDVVQKVKDFIEEKKGKIYRINDWGLRKLAYKIKKAKKAHYILMNVQVGGAEINEFKSLLDRDERVIRHLVMTMKKAETADTVPPAEFWTVRDEEGLDDEYDDEEEFEESDAEDEEEEERDDDEVDEEVEEAKEEELSQV